MAIADNIKAQLQMRHLRQIDLADAIGISSGTLSDWLKGRYYPRYKYIVKMSEYFGIPIDELTKENNTNPDDELMLLFNGLTNDKKEQAVEYVKFLLTQQEKSNKI